MSRTYKDQPNWVKVNNGKSKKRPYEYHDHTVFGKEIKRWVNVLDDNGEPLTETVIVPASKHYVNDYDSHIAFVYTPAYTYEVPIREKRTVAVYDNHCTIDEPAKRDDKNDFVIAPCEKYIADYRWLDERYDPTYRALKFNKAKQISKKATRKIIKQYNSGIIEGLDEMTEHIPLQTSMLGAVSYKEGY